MPNPEWGVKRSCPTTGKRFYDLNRTPIVSPYTGEVVDIEVSRRKAASAMARAVVEKEDETLTDDIEADDDILAPVATEEADIDDDLLEDDEDDTVSLDELADVPGDEE
ncbi:MAG: TIGR02300 family protein [Paracoccaceae bacterium]|nr:TIGR02300 family protein [Paracoccaceae bacterium]